MEQKVEIDGKKYNMSTLELLAGKRGGTEVEPGHLTIAKAIDYPDELPFLVEAIKALEDTDELRLALVRFQIDSELKMRDDLTRHQQRLYIAKTIEKLIFGGLLLDKKGGKDKDEDKPGDE